MKYLFALILAASLGCTSITPDRAYQSRVRINDEKYQEIVGVIHVHTKYSHDSLGTLEQIISAANDSKSDFVVITDHNSRGYSKAEGLDQGVLVVVGEELSVPEAHVIGLGHEYVPSNTFDQVIRDLHSQNAITIVAHPFSSKKWKNPSPIIDGIEVHNTGKMASRAGILGLLKFSFLYFFSKREAVAGLCCEERNSISLYDSLSAEKSLTAIVGADAHAVLGIPPFALDNYKDMFSIARNHVFVSQYSKNSLIEAIKKGHCFIGFDYISDSSGFFFAAKNKHGEAISGDALSYTIDTNLSVMLPRRGHVVLYKDGQRIKNFRGKSFIIPVKEPGLYRVEVYKDEFLFSREKIWIISNTINITL
ncbi:hypothetical protein HYV79_03010 [Candidatus Woesearchaeota archaeon]|nr:hypothetical protein [Candidatus Woesearchaeota archaeon]